jgi:hypothetical protein
MAEDLESDPARRLTTDDLMAGPVRFIAGPAILDPENERAMSS